MRRLAYFVALVVAGYCLASCHPLNRGFEFIGEYEAPVSQFRIQMIARGNIKGGHDISDEAFSLVRVCPKNSRAGKAFELNLISASNGSVKVMSQDLGLEISDWNWKSAERLLKSIFNGAGFSNVITEEIAGSVKVINGSLAGPKGTVLKGQIDTLTVLNTSYKYLMTTEGGQPNAGWIRGLYLKPCGDFTAQPDAAPDASRR